MILLDTHALVWWVADAKRLPAKARRALDAAVKANESVAVSSISLWEVAMLVARKRLTFTIDADTWISSVEALPFLTFVTVGATLVTADRRLRGYKPLATLWD